MPDADDLSRDRLLAELPRDERGRPVIGNVTLVKKIGAGGMGAVYLGRQAKLARDVAVKILPFTLIESDPTLVKRFVQEARLAASLESEHVVRVFDVGCEHRTHFYVMEFVPGESVGGLIKRHAKEGRPGMTEAAAMRVAIGAAKGLADAHDRGIVHRDVKPDNILIPEGNIDAAKLADLGLAKPHGTGQSYGTLSGVAMGTPGYMAPEQAEDAKAAGPAADVFAMGATLYTMVTGRPPFAGPSLIAVIRAAATGEPSPIPSTISPGVRWVVDRCLRKNPADRFKDGRQLLEALEKVRENPQSMKPPARRPAPTGSGTLVVASDPAPAPSRKWSVIAAAVVALLVIGLVILNALRDKQPSHEPSADAAPSKVEELFAKSAGLEKDGRLEEARDQLNAAVALGLDATRSRPVLERLEKAIAEKKSGSLRADAFAKHWEAAQAARTAADAKDTADSWTKVTEACTKARSMAAEADLPKVAALEAEAKQRIGWARAKALEADGKLEDGLAEALQAATGGPKNAALDEWIARVQAAAKTAATKADRKRLFDEAAARADAEPDPAKAMALWETARPLADSTIDQARADDAIKRLTALLKDSDRARLYDEAMKAGDAALAVQDFDGAERRFEEALGLRGNDAAATARVKQVAADRAKRLLADAKALLASVQKSKDWAGVQGAAEKILALSPADPEATAALAEAKRMQFAIAPSVKGNRIEVVLDAAKGVKMEFVTLKPAQLSIFDANGASKRVTITKEFAMMTTEVTQEMWTTVMGENHSHHPGDKHPNDSATWWEVQDFLSKLNQRLDGWTAALPTDAQWQYAATGGGKTAKYGFGDDEKALEEYAWDAENSQNVPHDVGLKKPNALGLFDMHGNSWEWCWDAYVELGEIKETTDPAESIWSKERLLHGGALNSPRGDCRTAFRFHKEPYGVLWEFGFRPILVKGEDVAPHVPQRSFDLGKGVTMTFRRVRGGSSPIGNADTRHTVKFTYDFWMQTTETTQAQWEAVMGPKEFAFKGADRPVESVTYAEAQEFAKKLSAKIRVTAALPTEAEWEVACRGMTDMLWYSGDAPARVDEIAWTVVNAKETHPVAQLRPNLFGLYDMSGNVWEWVADWYEPWTADPVTDPTGPKTGTERMLRGGCFTDNRELAASGQRMRLNPGSRQKNLGFRVVVR